MPFLRHIPHSRAFKPARSIADATASVASLEALRLLQGHVGPRTSSSWTRFVRSYVRRKTALIITRKQLAAYSKLIKASIKKASANASSRHLLGRDETRGTSGKTQSSLHLSGKASASKQPPSSMSRRRLASNRPALQCHVELPPVPNSALIKQHLQPSSPALAAVSLVHVRGTPNIMPITPVSQIMHTPENPPPCTQGSDATRRPKQKLRLNLDTIKPSRSNEYDAAPISPYLPFTPLETPTLRGITEGDAYPSDLSQRLSELKMNMTSSRSPQRPPTPPSPPKSFRRLPFSLPRRLSYRLSAPHSPSPLSMVASKGVQAAEAVTLASPLDVQKGFFRTESKSPRLPKVEMPKTTCSPFVNANSPCSYFSLQA